jgi:hypothetical protein
MRRLAPLWDAHATQKLLPRLPTLSFPEKFPLQARSQRGENLLRANAESRFVALRDSSSRCLNQIPGFFQYDNGFGEAVREPFCFLYVVRPQHIFQKSGAATGGGGPGGWSGDCQDAKRAIAQALMWKKEQQKPN